MTELEAGIAAARAGNKEQARTRLTRVLEADPHNETAWLWLSGIMPATEQALRCIERLLEINPQHKRAKEAQEVLRVRLLVEEAAIIKQNALPSTPKRRYLLGEALVDAGVITSAQLEQALQYQAQLARKKKPMRLGEILVRYKIVQARELEAALTAQMESLSNTASKMGLGRIGEYLVQHGHISLAQLHQCIALQTELRQQTGRSPLLGDILVRLGYMKQEQLTKARLQWQEDFEIAFR